MFYIQFSYLCIQLDFEDPWEKAEYGLEGAQEYLSIASSQLKTEYSFPICTYWWAGIQ